MAGREPDTLEPGALVWRVARARGAQLLQTPRLKIMDSLYPQKGRGQLEAQGAG